MNKPAPKEPSMDEILSSIRQIIADDDATAIPRRQPFQPTVAVENPPLSAAEPLALSPAQMIVDAPEVTAPEKLSFASIIADEEEEEEGEPEAEADPVLVDPEDVTFEAEPEGDPAEPEAQAEAEAEAMLADIEAESAPSAPQPEAFASPAVESFVPPRLSVAETAPMPDPTLSSDLAQKLLDPATDAAVRQTFARITPMMPVGNESLTIENLMREMLRPMLKEWLDEHLPTVVERMVEKEIARVSRGIE